jgi:TolB-like protein/Tfp pilus assembly protein PilF
VTATCNAVFISYASQDAAAAQRICDALRAAGVEVWLDQTELRGGDVWDQRIRREIHDCALFIPIISANTASRPEGYFRLEWDLADQRTHMMSRNRVFIVPVCLDATSHPGADVPESFQRAQWTRAPAGETPTSFVERVRRLLSPELSTTIPTSASAVPAIRGPIRAGWSKPARLVILAVVVFAVVGYVVATQLWVSRRGASSQSVTPVATSITSTAPTAFTPPAHSIAVLPFVNMSGDPQQEYFSDGLSEELLNALVRVSELKVAARTSAFSFKKKDLEIGDIARALNVGAILEGSVRKSGNKVRITAQLIKATDGYHLWSQTYDRTLDDIFVVQDDIAGEVVKALKVTLLGTTPVTRSRPVDPEAYNLALQGRFFLDRRGQQDLERSVDYFRRALERDPGYALGWAGLSQAYTRQATSGFVPLADGIRRARESAEKALALDSQLVDAHLAMGWIQQSYDWDWKAADASFRRALALEPGNTEALKHAGLLALTVGRWGEAIDLTNKAIERDPLRPNYYHNLVLMLLAVSRDAEAETASRKTLQLDPGGAVRHRWIGLTLLLQGKADAALQEMQQESDEGWRLSGLALAFYALGRRGESEAALADLKSKFAGDSAYQIAEVHAFRGEADLAFEWLERAYVQRDGGVTEIKSSRLMHKLVGDPRYKAFLRKVKLPG